MPAMRLSVSGSRDISIVKPLPTTRNSLGEVCKIIIAPSSVMSVLAGHDLKRLA